MQIIKLLGLIGLLMISLTLQAECVSLGKKDQAKRDQSIDIEASGLYSIAENIEANEVRTFDGHSWTYRYQIPTSVGILASNISVDLNQRVLVSKSAHTRAQGIFIRYNDATIRNGTLRVIGKQGVGVIHNASGVPHIKILDEKKEVMSCRLSYPDCEEVSYLNSIDKLPPKYQDAHITIDNMHIFVTYRGVQLADNHNTIRNSTIEVDDNTAIHLMGQYPIIENNTIIIHSNKNGDTETQKKYNIQIKDGAIKLRDAQGGIIRNNRIIYKGGLFSGKAPVAINLLDSKDVLIEGNTIEGFDKLVRENGDTSFTENDNTIKQ
jgi:hypothetical protein